MSKSPLALLTLFFFSGACSLVYQVVWVRMLMPVFGVSTFAVSIVLAAFMAGLALGSYWCGRVADRRGNQGEFHLHPWEKQQFVPLFEAAQGQKIGALIGPIAVEGTAAEVLSSEPVSGPYYAIFRLLDSTINAAPRPFAQAERRARALVRRQKQERLFGQFIIQLRHEYAAQIEVFRAQVEALVRNT